MPAPVSPVMTVRPGPELDAGALDERQVAHGQLTQHAVQSGACRHAGSSSAFWRSRSQKRSAPRGSMKRMGCPGRALRPRHPASIGYVVAAVDADDARRAVDDAHTHDVRRPDDDERIDDR